MKFAARSAPPLGFVINGIALSTRPQIDRQLTCGRLSIPVKMKNSSRHDLIRHEYGMKAPFDDSLTVSRVWTAVLKVIGDGYDSSESPRMSSGVDRLADIPLLPAG